jgi:hypothetical protein
VIFQGSRPVCASGACDVLVSGSEESLDMASFTSMGHRCGLAARCAAVALPRRQWAFQVLGYALGANVGQYIWRLCPQQRAQPRIIGLRRRGRATAAHRAAKPQRRSPHGVLRSVE